MAVAAPQRPGTSSRRKGGTVGALGCLAVALVLLVAMVLGVSSWLGSRGSTAPVPGAQRCVATAGDSSVALTLDQAHYASVIVGLSVRRGLPARAASIAMATAYQETGIRNLDYGDRDSVGLFQQRPSQGWGTAKQLQDPYYATGKFYDALVKIKNWQKGSINDVAQKIQRSGHPEAYRDHESDGRVLAGTLSGQAPGGFTCLERAGASGRAPALVTSLTRTFGKVNSRRVGSVVTIRARTAPLAWAYAHHAVANSRSFGLVSADVDGRRWRTDPANLPEWSAADSAGTVVTLTVR